MFVILGRSPPSSADSRCQRVAVRRAALRMARRNATCGKSWIVRAWRLARASDSTRETTARMMRLPERCASAPNRRCCDNPGICIDNVSGWCDL
jgi:hypothetical protein